MNSTSIIAAIIFMAGGYAVGHQHGGDRARFDMGPMITETVVADYPYAATCSAMLEAAWDVQDALPAGLPHNR